MNVFIARDGAVIGEYARGQAEEMARNGALLLTEDHYWQEGMADWLPLPDLLEAETSAEKIVELDRYAHFSNGTLGGPAANGALVFIARDGAVIGEYPRSRLGEMARAHELDRDDSYWREGMEDWLPLPDLLAPEDWEPPPPPLPPPNYRAIFGTGAAALLILSVIGFFWVKPNGIREVRNPTSTPPPFQDAATGIQVREKASADLRQRIERLPARAASPLNAFYYDVSVNMKKTFLRRTPWTATIHGFENVVEPGSDKTVSRTDFVLTTDYQDGEWVFQNYRAVTTDPSEGVSTQIERDWNDPTPPSIVGMLGLRRLDTSHVMSLKIREG